MPLFKIGFLDNSNVANKIIIGLCAWAFSTAIFARYAHEDHIYRNCESETWFGQDFIVHIKDDWEFTGGGIADSTVELGSIHIITGTYDGQSLIAYAQPSYDSKKETTKYSFIDAKNDLTPESRFPEGTRRFTLWVNKTSTMYLSEAWVWDENIGWSFGKKVANGKCVRIKGKP
jgi:hypothetical protein